MSEPENLVLVQLREMHAEMKAGFADVRSEIGSLRADVASDLVESEAKAAATEKRLVEQIAGLRRAVMEYHSSAIGHGIPFTELEERVSRLEARMDGAAPEGR